MIPGIAPTITPLPPQAGGTVLEGYITVGFGSSFYGFSDGSVLPAFGSVSGAASADMIIFVWNSGVGGSAPFNTAALVGGYLHFSGESALIEYDGSDYGAVFTPEQVAGWPTSGTHPFYLELP